MKKYILLFIILTVIAYPVYSDFSLPFFTYPSVNSDLNIWINNSLSDNTLYYKLLYDPYLKNNSFERHTSVHKSNFTKEGIYDFYFTDGTDTYPHKSFKIGFSKGNPDYLKYANGFINEQPQKLWSCNITNSDYGCELEDMQAYRAIAYSWAYHVTGNQSYKNISHLLFNSSYGTPAVDNSCDHADADFHCGFTNNRGYQVNGAFKQGILIYSHFSSFQHQNDTEIFDLGINYSMGNASLCNIWNDDYDCGNADDQGVMTLGYFKAYEITRDSLFYSKANALAQEALSYDDSPFLILAMWKAYELSGNVQYKEKAMNLSSNQMSDCRYSPCSPRSHASNILAFIDSYEHTGYYEYLRAAYDKIYIGTNSSCNPINGNYQCLDAGEQGLMAWAYYKAYQTLPSSNKFYEPKFDSNPLLATDLNLSVKFNGNITSPKLYLFEPNSDSPLKYDINRSTGLTTIPGADLVIGGVYSYYFNGSGIKFPVDNGSFKFVTGLHDEETHDKAELFSLSDPLLYCDPFGSNQNYNDYSCRLEHMQGWMINSFSKFLYISDNQTLLENMKVEKRLLNLSLSEIDDTDNPDRHQTCDHYTQDYNCNYVNDYLPSEKNKQVGGLKQMLMADSLMRSYLLTNNLSVRTLAENYITGYPEECNIWEGDFDCENETSQGSMIYLFWRAYEVFGEDIYRNVAINLSKNIDFPADNAEYLMLGLWYGYSLTGNSTYKLKAENISEELEDKCFSTSCNARELGLNIYTFWNSYKYSNDPSIQAAAYKKTQSHAYNDLIIDCDPNDAANEKHNCIWPDAHGLVTAGLWSSYQNYIILSNYSFDVNLSIGKEKYDLHDQINVSCEVNNTGNTAVYAILVNLVTNLEVISIDTSGEPSDDKNLVTYDFVDANQSIIINWTLNASKGGDQIIGCKISNFSDTQNVIVENIGDIYYKNFVESTYAWAGQIFTRQIVIANNASFKLTNFTMNIESESFVNVTNISSDWEELNVSSNFDRIYSSEFPSVHNFTLNITYLALESGYSTNSINISSAYGANSTIIQKMYVYDHILNHSVNIKNEIPFYRDINLSINFTNLEKFNLTNVSFDLNISNMDIISFNYSKPYLNTSDNISIQYSIIEPNQTISLNWTMYGLFVGNHSFSLMYNIYPNLSDVHYYNVTVNDSSINHNFTHNESAILLSIFNISLQITNIADHMIKSIVATTNVSSAFELINFSRFEDVRNIKYAELAYALNDSVYVNATSRFNEDNFSYTYDSLLGSINLGNLSFLNLDPNKNDMILEIGYLTNLNNNSGNLSLEVPESSINCTLTLNETIEFCNLSLDINLSSRNLTILLKLDSPEDFDLTIDYIRINTSSKRLTNAQVSDTTYIYNLTPNEQREYYWFYNVTNIDGNSSSINVYALPGFNHTYYFNISIQKIEESVDPGDDGAGDGGSGDEGGDSGSPDDNQNQDDKKKNKGSGGSGGSSDAYIPNIDRILADEDNESKSIVIKYNYTDYDPFDAIRNHSSIYSRTGFVPVKSIYDVSLIHNLTVNISSCIIITRTIKSDSIGLILDYSCANSVLEFCMYDLLLTKQSIDIEVTKSDFQNDKLLLNKSRKYGHISCIDELANFESPSIQFSVDTSDVLQNELIRPVIFVKKAYTDEESRKGNRTKNQTTDDIKNSVQESPSPFLGEDQNIFESLMNKILKSSVVETLMNSEEVSNKLSLGLFVVLLFSVLAVVAFMTATRIVGIRENLSNKSKMFKSHPHSKKTEEEDSEPKLKHLKIYSRKYRYGMLFKKLQDLIFPTTKSRLVTLKLKGKNQIHNIILRIETLDSELTEQLLYKDYGGMYQNLLRFRSYLLHLKSLIVSDKEVYVYRQLHRIYMYHYNKYHDHIK